MSRALAPGSWAVVVPVKGGPRAKSRLRAPDGVDHGQLATALALDTVTAVAGAVGPARVVVVTSDPTVAATVAATGAVVVPDPGAGLDAAVLAGARRAAGTASPAPRVAALLGDVPSATAGDVAAALAAATPYDAAVVPDADGVGTVLLTARTSETLRPRFGGASALAHEQAGAVRLDLDLPRLRRDVDDEASLRRALSLGVGDHTAALLAHLGTPAADRDERDDPRTA